jgi:hypothetical protein
MSRREIVFRAVVLGWAGGVLLYSLVWAVFTLSFLWPWANVQLRASGALRDIYERCGRIGIGSTLQDVTTAMHGLARSELAGARSMEFYTPRHSGDICRVRFGGEDPRVTRVDFLVD